MNTKPKIAIVVEEGSVVGVAIDDKIETAYRIIDRDNAEFEDREVEDMGVDIDQYTKEELGLEDESFELVRITKEVN